ncbi:hypothetical protein ACIRPK_17435 [Kitasatospora sp. NPDC101801]|uniref:hypothetical protein n=1 Tax=Kitasatospora sp. NPDC101801 TaxID=3364103 RepID=UPI00381A5741
MHTGQPPFRAFRALAFAAVCAAASLGVHRLAGGAPVQAGTLMAAATAAGIDGPVELVPPKGAGSAYAVKEIDKQWPVRLDRSPSTPAPAR